MDFKDARKQVDLLKKRTKSISVDYRRNRRQRILERLKYQCPKCGIVITESRKWVVDETEWIAICRRCHNMGLRVTKVDERYSFRGCDLRRARVVKGLSQKELAVICEWTPSYQCQLESSDLATLNSESVKKLRDALGGEWEFVGGDFVN